VTTRPGPHSGDDTFDRIDGALAALAEPRGAWLGDDLAAMTPVAGLIGQAERLLPQLVHDARASRLSWHEIAWAPVTSPDQARQRCDPESPVADGRWPYNSEPQAAAINPRGPSKPGRGHKRRRAPNPQDASVLIMGGIGQPWPGAPLAFDAPLPPTRSP
jgi:hypothetical protein